MTDEEKRIKIIKHKAKQTGYFIKMIVSLICVIVCFNLSVNTDGVISVLFIALVFICIFMAFIFKMLHQGMLYCPLCGASFGYGSWMSGSMPLTCPHCKENLYYR